MDQLGKVDVAAGDERIAGFQVPDNPYILTSPASLSSTPTTSSSNLKVSEDHLSEEAGLMTLVKSLVELLNQLTVRHSDQTVRDLVDEVSRMIKASSRLIHTPSDVREGEVRGMYRQGRKTYKPPPTDARIREVIRQVIMRLKNPQDYVCRCVTGSNTRVSEGNGTSANVSQPIEKGKPEAIQIVPPPVLGVGDDLSHGKDSRTRHLLPRGRSMRDDFFDYDADKISPAVIDGIAKSVGTRWDKTGRVVKEAADDADTPPPPPSLEQDGTKSSLIGDIGSGNIPAAALNPLEAIITSLQQYSRTVRVMNQRLANITDIMSRLVQTGTRFLTGQLKDNKTFAYGEPLRKGLESYVDVVRAASNQVLSIENHLSDLRENVVGLIRGTAGESIAQLAGGYAALSNVQDKAPDGSDNERSLLLQPIDAENRLNNKKRDRQAKRHSLHEKRSDASNEDESKIAPGAQDHASTGRVPRPLPLIPVPTITTEADYYDTIVQDIYEGEQPASPSPLLGSELPHKELFKPEVPHIRTPMDQLSDMVTALQSSLSQLMQVVARVAGPLGR